VVVEHHHGRGVAEEQQRSRGPCSAVADEVVVRRDRRHGGTAAEREDRGLGSHRRVGNHHHHNAEEVGSRAVDRGIDRRSRLGSVEKRKTEGDCTIDRGETKSVSVEGCVIWTQRAHGGEVVGTLSRNDCDDGDDPESASVHALARHREEETVVLDRHQLDRRETWWFDLCSHKFNTVLSKWSQNTVPRIVEK